MKKTWHQGKKIKKKAHSIKLIHGAQNYSSILSQLDSIKHSQVCFLCMWKMPVLNTKMSFSDLNYAFYAISLNTKAGIVGEKKRVLLHMKFTSWQRNNYIIWIKKRTLNFINEERPPDLSFLKKHSFVSYLRKNKKSTTITGNTHAHSGKRKQNVEGGIQTLRNNQSATQHYMVFQVFRPRQRDWDWYGWRY